MRDKELPGWRLGYALGLAMGLAAVFWLLGWQGLLARLPYFGAANGDLAQNLTGHLAYQTGPWRWPILVSETLFWPRGLSIAVTDSNPLLSLLARLVVAPLAGGPVNLFGAWLGLCFLLQPVAAIYALRGFVPEARGLRALALAVTAGAMALLWPTLAWRLGHTNLMAHFLLLIALGLSARALRQGRALPAPGPALALLAAAILLHPYLFLFAAAVLAAPLLRRPAGGWRGALRPLGGFLLLLGLPVLLHRLLSGATSGQDQGYGLYSMNLLSPLWPQYSGLFGADLPLLDATGGQREGFNYLGAGTLLLLLAALALGWRRDRWQGWRRWAPLLLVMAGLTLLAVTPRAYAGPWLVLPLPIWPWDQLFGIVRASGRAFWPVGYALLLGALAWLGLHLRLRQLLPLLGLALALQAVDARPVLLQARQELHQADWHRRIYGAAAERPLPQLPPHVALLRLVPPCGGNPLESLLLDRLRLAALRQGAKLAEIRTSRMPEWFNCQRATNAALETPLAPGELRVVLGEALRGLRPEALGLGAECRRQEDLALCAIGLPLAGTPLQPAPLPRLEDGLPALLVQGWLQDGQTAWSRGPYPSLLFAGGPARLRLRLQGIGRAAGAPRQVQITVQDAAPLTVTLPDLQETELLLTVPDPAQPVRILLGVGRSALPAERGLESPAPRTAVRLLGLSAAE